MRPLNFRFFMKRLCPFLFCVFLILCSLIPFHLLPYYPYAVSWIFIPIFYFAIYNPKYLNAWSVFILGLILESLIQSPAGVISFCCVLMFFLANLLRKYLLELTFWPLWGVFAAVLGTILLVECILVSLLVRYSISFKPAFVEFLILVLMYPLLMRFCAHLDRKIREST